MIVILIMQRDTKYVIYQACLNLPIPDLCHHEHGARVVMKLFNSQHVEVTILILSVVGAEGEQLSLSEWGNLVVQKCIKGSLKRARECKEVMAGLHKLLDILVEKLPILA